MPPPASQPIKLPLNARGAARPNTSAWKVAGNVSGAAFPVVIECSNTTAQTPEFFNNSFSSYVEPVYPVAGLTLVHLLREIGTSKILAGWHRQVRPWSFFVQVTLRTSYLVCADNVMFTDC